MHNNEIITRKKRHMARVISTARSLRCVIECLMDMMIAEDVNKEFSLIDPEDGNLFITLDTKAREIDDLAALVLMRYKEISKKDCQANP